MTFYHKCHLENTLSAISTYALEIDNKMEIVWCQILIVGEEIKA